MDPAIHNSNTPKFRGARLVAPVADLALREGEALEAIRRFMGASGRWPTAESWTAAGMTPSEKTIRRRFGSFRAAIEAVRLHPDSPDLTSKNPASARLL